MSYERSCPRWQPIGRRLATIRGETPQQQMSRVLAVSTSTYGRLERGAREMGADVLVRLAGLGWNPRWILTGEGPRRLDAAGSEASESAPTRVDAEHLGIALELADAVLEGRWLPRARYADLVCRLYDASRARRSWEDVHGLARSLLTAMGVAATPMATPE